MSLLDDLAALFKSQSPLSGATYQYATDPQSLSLPKIVLGQPEAKRTYSNDGDIGMGNPFIQIDVIAASMGAARTLAAAIRSTLNDLPVTSGGSTIRCAIMENEMEMAEPVAAGREKPNQKIVQAWRITFDDPI